LNVGGRKARSIGGLVAALASVVTTMPGAPQGLDIALVTCQTQLRDRYSPVDATDPLPAGYR